MDQELFFYSLVSMKSIVGQKSIFTLCSREFIICYPYLIIFSQVSTTRLPIPKPAMELHPFVKIECALYLTGEIWFGRYIHSPSICGSTSRGVQLIESRGCDRGRPRMYSSSFHEYSYNNGTHVSLDFLNICFVNYRSADPIIRSCRLSASGLRSKFPSLALPIFPTVSDEIKNCNVYQARHPSS